MPTNQVIKDRNQFRIFSRLVLILSLTALLECVILIFVIAHPTEAKYYLTNQIGNVIPLRPLSEPIIRNNFITTWAGLQAQQAFSLDFVKYNEQFSELHSSFTDQGWTLFKSALNKVGIIEQLNSEKLVTTAVVTSTPVIIRQGVFRGVYTWRVKVPLLVTFVSASSQTQQHISVTMQIKRVPVMNVKQGIQIDEFIS